MVVLRSSKSTDGSDLRQEVHLVTGGGGYAGFWLGRNLAARGHRVILIDVRDPIWTLKENMKFMICDLTNRDMVKTMLTNVDCVYHMASYGMSGREQLNRRRIEAVNVGGTENVIQACIANDVTRLVYTSTYNVIFGGQTIINGDESLPYLPLNKQPDHYSRTKSIAEQKVLSANTSVTDGGKTLHTCALRLAAVYGPGEQRHIPRIVDYIEKGLFSIIYETDTLQDFLHVENLAQAHELAGRGLTEDKNCIAAGQAYFVSDDAPINTFSFFGPLITGLGYPMPSLRLPISLIYFVAFLTEWLHYLISYVYNFQPLLTRTEVYKTGVTHTFSIKKARDQLEYSPTIQNDISKVIQHYINTGHMKPTQKKGSAITQWIVNIFIGALFAFLIMSFLPVAK
ncbi:short-chain dehydrogenase/reductase family 42E member 1-like [Ruditapes philippinarum]|uniref:short-chain dehydrogenase/reductase family 42E member 1-like n=1 Tax=Ruditapes philippinarum TaxID=129788 RepID=UPI00295A84C3|nr:short-chain dehydrogenase/reductase family 42E member 1-like [Ruditapes philippinarum]XP_060592781.1 short-chain dehydrogenase/reductase family 42E member 1-like [Ruditapes philippinarum]XP_060592782.1 short-chain dehydrogenase/reductase family 42E member 1-like [Ruditapes philippinarum]